MNRREMLQAGLSVITAAGIEGTVATLDVSNPQAIVLKFPGRLTSEHRKILNEQWKRMFRFSQIANVPVVVLDGGVDIAVIDKKDAQ